MHVDHAASKTVVAARPLLITSDVDLLDDLLRLAAAAGVELHVAADPGSARRFWASAPLVLVGDDQAETLARQAFVDRRGVVLVAQGAADVAVFRRGMDITAEQVALLPDAEGWLVDRLADAADGSPVDGMSLCVIGGRGGAGASTLAGALAITGVHRGLRTFLLDADPLGGGIDLVLGSEDTGGVRWPDLGSTRGRVSAASLRDALPAVGQLSVLSWDRGDCLAVPTAAMRSVLSAARRGSDLLVVDLPRRLDDSAQEAVARSSVTLVVVPAEVRAVASAARVVTGLAAFATDVRVVVRGPAPSGLPAEVIADSLGLPLAGFLKSDNGIPAALERGEPPIRRGRGPMAGLCVQLLDDLLGHSGRRAA